MKVERSSVAAWSAIPPLRACWPNMQPSRPLQACRRRLSRMDSYRELERLGLLRVLSAMHEGRQIGFLTLLAPVLPHYGVVVAVSESFFVARAHRGTGAGLKLLRLAEDLAREAGSPGLLVSAPSKGLSSRYCPHRLFGNQPCLLQEDRRWLISPHRGLISRQ